MRRVIISLACLALALVAGVSLHGAHRSFSEPVIETFTVDGVQRTALIYPSREAESASPLVFVFHGHGGRAQAVARRLRIHELWPEAVVVYMQGLAGVAGITDPEGRRSGWQKNPGQLGDRDVKFFDIALAGLEKERRIDASRIYALGHSNGARFVNVLWNMRGDRFAAFCSASAQGGALIRTAKPKSIFMIAGEKDHLVPFETQTLSVELARRLLRTDQSKAKTEGYGRMEPGTDGTELVAYLHPSGHEFPQAALPMVVRFFQRHTRN
jgi:polyhydroxybutyrate depolymerase